MANYRRSLTTSARLFARQRFPPSFSYIHHDDDRRNPHSDEKLKSFLQNRSYGCFGSNNTNTLLGFGSFRDPRCYQFLHDETMIKSRFLLSARNISTTNLDVAEAEKTEDKVNNIADVVTDKAIEIVSGDHAPLINEFAMATADSWLPVGFLQVLIVGIHDLTGLNWWTSIVITTLLIRALLVPFQINQLKASSKLNILWQQMDQLTKELKNNKGMSPTEEAESRERLKRVSKEYAASGFAPLKSMFIQGPVLISFFLAIRLMVENVPSFETGGVSWFIDLTTADSLYILPFLAAFSCLLNIECNMHEGDHNATGKMKINISRGLAVLTLPLTASFPNAFFFYWIPSNVFSTVFGLIMKKPSVKKLLDIPSIVPPPPSQGVSSSSVLGYRINKLEKKFKGRKKKNK